MNGFRQQLGHGAGQPAGKLEEAAARLVADATSAARLRAYRSDPNVAVLTVERTRDRLDRWGWVLLFAGLAYTTVNVQMFVAAGTPLWSLRWTTAWLVEPMVMGLMLVLLRGEQVINWYGGAAGGWVRGTRWIALAITYVMNTGTYWERGDGSEVFTHSVPVLVVFLAAEALVQQRQGLTDVIERLDTTLSAPQSPDECPVPVTTPQDQPRRPETPQEHTVRSEASTSNVRAIRPAGSIVGAAYAAYRELALEALNQGGQLDGIRPGVVDKRANVRAGTAKVTGRMAQFRARFEQERREYGKGSQSQGDEDTEDAG
jgi:hypothetical protein